MTSVDELVVRVRDRINYADIFGELLPSMRDRGGDERMAFCPFHDNTNTRALSVNVRDGLYFCHSCKAHGDLFDMYRKKRSLTFMEALNELAQRVGVDTPDNHHHHRGYTVAGGDPTRRRSPEEVLAQYLLGREQHPAASNGSQSATSDLGRAGLAAVHPAASGSHNGASNGKRVWSKESTGGEERLAIGP